MLFVYLTCHMTQMNELKSWKEEVHKPIASHSLAWSASAAGILSFPVSAVRASSESACSIRTDAAIELASPGRKKDALLVLPNI